MVTLQLHRPLFSDAVLERRLINFLTLHNLCIRATWNVFVRGSVAFLRGRVNDRRSLARLEAYCRRVPGVIDVDSSAVQVKPPAPIERPDSTSTQLTAIHSVRTGRNHHAQAIVG